MSDIVGGGPARSALALTPHDTNALTPGARGIYVGTSGDIAMRTPDDSVDVVFKSVPVGIFPVRPAYVRATLTTASNLIALY
jgi:hypothetical protein